MSTTQRFVNVFRAGVLLAAAACVPPAGTSGAGGAGPDSSGAVSAERRITINGRALSERDVQILAYMEAQGGGRTPDGDYWYDDTSGLAGAWGGPAATSLAAGLGLGGPLPPNASGGGDGRLSGVFINGRELHPIDVQGLANLVGPVPPGRYWLDGQGNAGPEGGVAAVNLVQLMQASQGQGGGAYDSPVYRRHDTVSGDTSYVSGGCVYSSTKKSTISACY